MEAIETHQKIREILQSYGNPEFGDCIVDELCFLFGHPTTTDIERLYSTQEQLQRELQSLGYNVVSCGNCGDVLLHRTPTDEIQCPHCTLVGEPCDFPDLY